MTADDLLDIFHARARKRVALAKAQNSRFAYYTTAATARLLIEKGEVWMRLPSCMNDFSEINHGLATFRNAWRSASGAKLRAALESLEPGCTDRLIDHVLNQTGRLLFTDTFIACLSEHSDADNQFGRLSMWRAYGGSSGVAIVINPDVMHSEDTGLGAYSSPVEYFEQGLFDAEFEVMADQINANAAGLRTLPHGHLFEWMESAAIASVLSIKHPAFAEEREWRMFSSNAEWRGRLERAVETINGIPQPILKLPVNDRVLKGEKNGLALDDLIHKVLIGPTQYPIAIAESLVEVMAKAGVRNPADRVRVTEVPLRMPG